jgi:hypothetical protein
MRTAADYHSLVWQRTGQSRERARTTWDYRDVIGAGPDKVHFRIQSTRYRADGTPIGSYRSLYIVTWLDGRWAIQGLSCWAE